MPPRSTPPPKSSFYPQNDNTTYRDLLLFEERLKTNAASLQSRKSRYQLFLFQLLLVIAFLLSEVLLPPQSSFLVIPYKLLLQQLLPDIYTPHVHVTLHPYFASGLLFVSVTTLVLFFASGMYSEKIAYANKYVPHANRALRSFNMYFNVRKPPLRSKITFNPLSFFFPRPDDHSNASSPSSSQPSRSRSPSPARSPSRSPPTSLPIPSIPPATNPRGELIFSGRVDKNFRESYERYRSAFERKREEKERAERRSRWLAKLFFWRKTPPPALLAPVIRTVSSSSSSRGNRSGGSRSGTPPTTAGPSGSGSAGAGAGADGIVMRQRERGGSVTPPGKQRSGITPSPHRERGRRELGQEVDMRTLALERSLSHGR